MGEASRARRWLWSQRMRLLLDISKVAHLLCGQKCQPPAESTGDRLLGLSHDAQSGNEATDIRRWRLTLKRVRQQRNTLRAAADFLHDISLVARL